MDLGFLALADGDLATYNAKSRYAFAHRLT
jgi:hypothetical protein